MADLFSNLDFLPKSGFPKILDLFMDFPRISHPMDFPPHGFWIFGEAAGAADKNQDWKPRLETSIFSISWIFDVLDACLMVHGSWLKAHGSWPREARGGSWLMARCRPGPGDPQARGAGPGPGARLWLPRAGAASGYEP